MRDYLASHNRVLLMVRLSPSRVAAEALGRDVYASGAFDLSTGSSLRNPAGQERVWERLEVERAVVVFLSPESNTLSTWMQPSRWEWILWRCSV